MLTAGEPLPDLDVLLARLGDCEAAARRAESAAGAAEAAGESVEGVVEDALAEAPQAAKPRQKQRTKRMLTVFFIL